jgi:hypothetical protein
MVEDCVMATSASLTRLHCGDRVRLKEDPRHVGTVQAIINNVVRVKWIGTAWISDESPAALEKVT